jgi:hypothetical protein
VDLLKRAAPRREEPNWRLRMIVLAFTTAAVGAWVSPDAAARGGAPNTRASWLTSTATCAVPPGGFIGKIKMIVTTDTQSRRIVGLPAMSADSVTAVTDTSVCRRAATAYGRSLTPPDTISARTVSVVRAGSSYYVVSDSTRYSGEWGAAFLFSSSLTGTALIKFTF